MNSIEIKDFLKNLKDEEINFLKDELWKEFIESTDYFYFEIEIDGFITTAINKLNIDMKYFTMEHRGGLKEALETKKQISFDEFIHQLSYYKYYTWDDRINCHRYILKDIENNLDKPMWLLRTVKKLPKNK